MPQQTMSEQLKQMASSLVPFASVFSGASFQKKPTPAQLEPRVFGPGVTGVDLSLPVFVGTSTDPHDYLIDLDTDSMERYADVRSYFHWVGDLIQDRSTPPTEFEARKRYDDDLVRQGRLHIRAEKALGHG
jgi:hypothetical protein